MAAVGETLGGLLMALGLFTPLAALLIAGVMLVAITKGGECLVGQIAKRQAVTNPEQTVFSIKRLMGRKYDDPEVQRTRETVPYRITRAANGDARVTLARRDYSPPEISAMILQKLKMDAEAHLGKR